MQRPTIVGFLLRCLIVLVVVATGYLTGVQATGVAGGLVTAAALGAGAVLAVFGGGRQSGKCLSLRRHADQPGGRPRHGSRSFDIAERP